MLNSSLCDFSCVYIVLKGTVKVVGKAVDTTVIEGDRNNK